MTCEFACGFSDDIRKLLVEHAAARQREHSAPKSATTSERAEEERLLEQGLKDQEKVRGIQCPSTSHLCIPIPKEGLGYSERGELLRN